MHSFSRSIILFAISLLASRVHTIFSQNTAIKATFEQAKSQSKGIIHVDDDKEQSLDLSDDDDLNTQHERWEWITQKCLLPDSTIASPILDYEAYRRLPQSSSKNNSGLWKSIGPYELSQSHDGIGRVETVAFHPNQP